ncbi:hypothetical protein GS399_10930 [Pedobacter sp. HMF7647]|uniref:Auto-transporter adhesin head GIN domain-containing protein n=1 Tax=Hufsiella arboris TaxID=2695275 RepID=A0A7K1YA94_9SPHI|nr:hypothetical protein [Hufsiella arboris]MXV51484.1 hypothetical protein [Hufsiella arboris]
MKTSNKLLLAALIILTGSMVAYDTALKAEYQTGNFKSRFRNLEQQQVGQFNTIRVNSANLISVSIEHNSSSKVWISKWVKDRVTVESKNGELIIDVKEKYKADERQVRGSILILCPKVVKITTKSDSANSKYIDNRQLTVTGFDQRELNLDLGLTTDAFLEKTKLNALKAKVGGRTGESSLMIANNNQIATADIEVPGKNHLELLDPDIKSAKLNLADSSKITLMGRALSLVKK